MKRARNQGLTLEGQRQLLDNLANQVNPPVGMHSVVAPANGIGCEWVKANNSTDAHTIFYLHGGTYTHGSIQSHRSLAARLADASGGRALMVSYRLAPEFPFPTAIDDTISAYTWLIKRVPPNKIVFAGDAAGGGLVVTTLLKLKEDKIAMPAGAVLLCPWVDLECGSESYDTLAAEDPILDKAELLEAAKMYYQKESPRNPFVSPLYAELKGLPPLFIQLGTCDLLFDEGKKLAAKAEEAGVKVELDIWEQMIHGWQLYGNRMPEAMKAIRRTSDFIRKRTA